MQPLCIAVLVTVAVFAAQCIAVLYMKSTPVSNFEFLPTNNRLLLPHKEERKDPAISEWERTSVLCDDDAVNMVLEGHYYTPFKLPRQRPYSMRGWDWQWKAMSESLPECQTVEELQQSLQDGSRVGLKTKADGKWVSIQSKEKEDYEVQPLHSMNSTPFTEYESNFIPFSFTTAFRPALCKPHLFDSSALCSLLSEISATYFIGNSLARHASQGLLMALSGDFRSGAVKPLRLPEAEQQMCQCDGQFSESLTCRTLQFTDGGSQPISLRGRELCTEQIGDVKLMYYIDVFADFIASKFSCPVQESEDDHRPVLFVLFEGIHFDYESSQCIPRMDAFFHTLAVASEKCKRPMWVIWGSGTVQASALDSRFRAQVQSRVRVFNKEMIEYLRKQKDFRIGWLDLGELTWDQPSSDGVHALAQTNYFIAQYIANWVELQLAQPSTTEVLESETDDEDVALLESLFFEHHLLGGKNCDSLNPQDVKGVRNPSNLQGGFGMLLTFHLLNLHTALMMNRTYLGASVSFGQWTPLKEVDVFRVSACHSRFHANPSEFKDVFQQEGGMSAFLHLKHPLFYHRSLLWYYRHLLRLFFSDVALGKDFATTLPERLPFEPRIGVHIRRGDSCFAKINPHRPPCQSAAEYARFAAEYVKTLKYTPPSVHILISSDSTDAFQEFQVEFAKLWSGPVDYSQADIDRTLYKPPAENTMVDHFLVSEKEHITAYKDFLKELVFLARSDVLVAQFYSAFADIAFLVAPNLYQYASVDGALPCARGGCPGPLDQAGEVERITDRLNEWNFQKAYPGKDALWHSLRILLETGGNALAYSTDEEWISAFDVRKTWSVCFDSTHTCSIGRNCASDIAKSCFY